MKSGRLSVLPFCLLCLFVAHRDAPAKEIVVAGDGSGDYKTVQQAVDHVPDGNQQRIIIRIKPGVYREQISVSAAKRYVTFRGDDPLKTILTYRLSAQEAGNTRLAFSTFVNADEFRAENITFENTFGTGSQAVALFVDADRTEFHNCRFLGWQDTLFVNGGRQFFEDCYIEGHVDFIFGNGSVIFESCTIHSRGAGYVTAHYRTSEQENTGFVFVHCRLTGADNLTGVYLGRPWRPYARVVFIDCWLGPHIKPEGWDNWRDPAREKTAWFGEYDSTGPGANPKARVAWSKQLTAADTAMFARARFFSSADRGLTEKIQRDIATIAWVDAQKKSDDWFPSVEALRIADNLLIYQLGPGGWPKNIDMGKTISDAERAALLRQKNDNDSTIDNGATYSQLTFLARVYTAQHQERHREAFLRGFDYLIKAQYPNGGWPQFYPNLSGYYKHITFNDNAMIGVMKLLRDVAAAKHPYAFVDEARRTQAAKAVEKGIECILKTQILVNGRRTVWCAQHDEITLAPAPARTYELVSLSGGESVDVVRFLMSIGNPSPAVVEAIEGAVAWFRQSQLKNALGGPTWARFYQIETNRPIFVGRDGVIKYNLSEIEEERRNGYAWYVDGAAGLLEKDYPAWHEKLNDNTTRVH